MERKAQIFPIETIQISNSPKALKTITPHKHVKQGKEGGVKGKESAEGKPIGAGETPCFA